MIRGGRRRLRNAILEARVLGDEEEELYRLALENIDKISDTEAVTLSLILDSPMSKTLKFFSRLFEGYTVYDSLLYVGLIDESQVPLPGGGYARAFKLDIRAYNVILKPVFVLRVADGEYRYRLYLGRLNLAEGKWNPVDDMAALIRERHWPGAILAFLAAASHAGFHAVSRAMFEEGEYRDEQLGYRIRPGEAGSLVVCDLDCSRRVTVASQTNGATMLVEALKAAYSIIGSSIGEDELVRAIEEMMKVKPGEETRLFARLDAPTLPALLAAAAGVAAPHAYTSDDIEKLAGMLVKVDEELNVTVAGKLVVKPANIYRLARALRLSHVEFNASKAPLHRILALAAAGVYIPPEAAREVRRRILRGETREVLKLPRSLVPRALSSVGLHSLLVEALARVATVEE